MRHSERRAWLRPRRLSSLVIVVVALVTHATLGGAGNVSAAPAAGYTASLIPTGLEEFSVAVDPATDTVYFASENPYKITVVDGASNTVTDTITLPGMPRAIAADPVTDTVYVVLASSPAGTPAVDVIDGATNAVTATIPLPAGSNPAGIAADSTTDTVYVAEQSAAAVAVLDGSTNAVTATVSTAGAGLPVQLAVDETTDVVWVADGDGVVQAISGTSKSVTRTISLGPGLQSVAVNPVSNTVYAAMENAGVAVIDGSAGTVSATISVTGPLFSVAVDPGTGTVFGSSFDGSGGSGTTWVIDGSKNTLVDTIPRGGRQIALNTATGSAYAAPLFAQTNAAWVLTPSAANAWSPVVKSRSATLTAGTAGSFAIVGTALPAATYTETGQLPSGVTFSPSGVLSGTPAAGTGGVYPITITASNGVAPDYSQAFSLVVDEAPTLTAPPTATFRVGAPVSVPIQVTGYPAPNVLGSNLPAGVQLTEPALGTWQLSGTPAAGSGGLYQAELSAANIAGGSPAVSMAITVQETPSFTSAPTTTFLTDSNNGYIVAVHGYPADTLTVATSVPSWLHLDSGGFLWGDPPAGAQGVYRFTIAARNSLGSATQAFTLTVAQPIALGAVGSDGQLWVQAPQLGFGWHPLGGKIIAPPAVAAPPNPNGSAPVPPLFIATGTNNHLYIRSLATAWQLLGPVAASCLGAPAAVITGTPPAGPFTLTVACRGLDNALWMNRATLPVAGLPSFTSGWTRLGGVLSAGPAAAPVRGTMTFFVRGATGQIYTRTLAAGYKATPWFCVGQPAAATLAASGQTIFAWQGRDHALWEATTGAAGWNAATSLGGSLVGGPAVAATSLATYLLAEGTNHAVWERAASSGWITLGGSVIGGVGAAALN